MSKPSMYVSITATPPFVEVGFEIPLEFAFRGRLRSWLSEEEARQVVAVVLRRILEAQYADGDARGAWAKDYPAFLSFVYNERLPGDIGVRDSISVSGLIARALSATIGSRKFPNVGDVLAPRLDAFIRYLHYHFSEHDGGFGLRSRPTSTGSTQIVSDLKHTAWALMSLINIGPTDATTHDRLQRAASYIRAQLEHNEKADERAVTYALLHFLLSSTPAGKLVVPTDATRTALVTRLESRIAETYDDRFGSWDTRVDPPEKSAIDNALYVLYCMPLKNCSNSSCRDALVASTTRMLSRLVNSELPFSIDIDGPPDPGATATLAYVLAKNATELGLRDRDISPLVRAAARRLTLDDGPSIGYTWDIASMLLLATDAD